MNTGQFTSSVAHIEHVEGDGVKWRGVYYHNLLMTNGDKINIGKKKMLQEGEELSYEVVEVGQQEFNKAKSYNPDYQGSNDAPPAAAQAPAPKAKSANASFALSYAKDAWVGGTVADEQGMFDLAIKMKEWLDLY